MPLELKLRGSIYHAHGRVEYNGRPITKYERRSTGASTEAGARSWCREFEERAIRRHLLGAEAEIVTFSMGVLKYPAKTAEAKYLAAILTARPDVGDMAVTRITGKFIKNLGLELYPNCATDTVWRQVVTPMRAVVNNLHELGEGPLLKVRRFSERERIDRDIARGKQSRQARRAGGIQWNERFCAYADPYNAALACFVLESGARIDQAISVRPCDLDLANRRVWLKAQKGHEAQWVEISHELMIMLANLPPKRPRNRKHGYSLEPRVFGYGTTTGYRKRWRSICKAAGIEELSAHEAGRHGFATELMIRQGVDPVTVAKHGRWSSPQLLLSTYSHAEASQAEIRERFRTEPAQANERIHDKPLKKGA